VHQEHTVQEHRELENARQSLPPKADILARVERLVYPHLPRDGRELIELFDLMVAKGSRFFWLVTVWIKRRSLYDLGYFPYYERWLQEHVDQWGTCDIFCYRVLNPMVERYPQLFERVLSWTESPKTYVRRAAAVCLLESTQSFRVNQDLDKVLLVAERLKHDPEEHVRKGVGWLLKYAYLADPERVRAYLEENVDNLPRVIFRYALEKAPPEVRRELMSLEV